VITPYNTTLEELEALHKHRKEKRLQRDKTSTTQPKEEANIHKNIAPKQTLMAPNTTQLKATNIQPKITSKETPTPLPEPVETPIVASKVDNGDTEDRYSEFEDEGWRSES
jgi:hypothetical protein